MDLSNLKNMDLSDLMSKLKSGSLGDKKTLIKFGIGFGAISVSYTHLTLPTILLV